MKTTAIAYCLTTNTSTINWSNIITIQIANPEICKPSRNHANPAPINVPIIRFIPLSQICLRVAPCIIAAQETGTQYGFSKFRMVAANKAIPIVIAKIADSPTSIRFAFSNRIASSDSE